MSFSDLVHSVTSAVSDVLVPRDMPSSVQEAEAQAKAAEGVPVTIDPELEPIFQSIGDLGNSIEGALKELGNTIGALKEKIAARQAAPVASLPSLTPPGEAPVGTPDPAAPQPAAAPAPTEAVDPNPLPAPASESTEPSTTEPDVPPAEPSEPSTPAPEPTPAPVADPAPPA
jgi:hypothetical protein